MLHVTPLSRFMHILADAPPGKGAEICLRVSATLYRYDWSSKSQALRAQQPVSLAYPVRRTSSMADKDTFRVVTRESDGKLRIRDYASDEPIRRRHSQIGIDDCSTDLGLRGMPVFRGLIGPIPEGANIVRYESPEVFESITKEWGTSAGSRRRGRRATQSQ
jgi:hypothetical protein